MVITIYNCKQRELYNACRIGWKLYRQYLLRFTAYKARFTEGVADENEAKVEAADFLPDSDAREVVAQSLRIDLVQQRIVVTDLFQTLKGYINDAFPANKQTLMYKAAGQQYYEKSALNNWSSATALLSSALPFITDNKTDLMANQNMPAAFATAFVEAGENFTKIYKDFNTAVNAAAAQTADKVTASNEIYTLLMAMLADAQICFRKDPDIAAQFVWATILAQARGVKASGFAGKITRDNAFEGTKNATVNIVQLNKTITTDSEGRFDTGSIAAGVYMLNITAEGHELKTMPKYEVKTGTISRLNVHLKSISSNSTPTSQN